LGAERRSEKDERGRGDLCGARELRVTGVHDGPPERVGIRTNYYILKT